MNREFFQAYWGGDGAPSTLHVREIVEPLTTWNSPSWPSTLALGVTTWRWKTREWNPEVVEIYKREKKKLYRASSIIRQKHTMGFLWNSETYYITHSLNMYLYQNFQLFKSENIRKTQKNIFLLKSGNFLNFFNFLILHFLNFCWNCLK